MIVQRLCLQTAFLEDLRDFYVETLELPLVSQQAEAFAVQCGNSILEFEKGENAYYHFAFNIPSEMLPLGAKWLQTKGIELLPFEGEEIVHFPNWDAAGIYFHDPAGNIVEFIARKRLDIPNQPQFGMECMLCISEIGFATFSYFDMLALLLEKLRLPQFWSSGNQFTALGDEQGLVILVDANLKKWIPTMVPALPFPFTSEILQTGISYKVTWDNLKLVFS